MKISIIFLYLFRVYGIRAIWKNFSEFWKTSNFETTVEFSRNCWEYIYASK